MYRKGSGRDAFIDKHWKFTKKNPDELKSRLTELQYHVTQNNGTEPPFRNEFWDDHREGIYVDIVSGELCSAPWISSTPRAAGRASRSRCIRAK